jgi:hypothetical protein
MFKTQLCLGDWSFTNFQKSRHCFHAKLKTGQIQVFFVDLPRVIYCTFTAHIRKLLIINGAGGGNRTLVPVVFFNEVFYGIWRARSLVGRILQRPKLAIFTVAK